MNRRSPGAEDPEPSDGRYSEWDCLERLGVDGQPERSRLHRVEEVVSFIPGLDYRPGQDN